MMEPEKLEITRFLEWLWYKQEVQFFRRIYKEETCTRCKGSGSTTPRLLTDGDDPTEQKIQALLNKVSPRILGTECVYCRGKGVTEIDDEIEGPIVADYWIEGYEHYQNERKLHG